MRYLLSDIAEICGAKLVGADIVVDNVATDSRSLHINPSTLFVAIDGANHDGHRFIDALYRRGVRAFLVERPFDVSRYAEAGFISVESSVVALQSLAAHYRKQFKGKVVGVTGSNGKTVVKEWATQLLSPEMKIFRSPKSYNSQIGVPLSILMIEGDEDVAIIEAGISKPHEMELLERIIAPQIGIITTIGEAHSENFDSMQYKLQEKLTLFKGAHTIIYNSAYSEIAQALGQTGKTLIDSAQIEQCKMLFRDSASEQDAALAAALCDVLGVDHAKTLERLRTLEPVALRLEVREGVNNSIIVNDFYNSDINSLSIAVEYLGKIASGRAKTVILSDILQSSMPPHELYGKVVRILAEGGIDHIIGVGKDIFQQRTRLGCAGEFYQTIEEALHALTREKIADRAILIKGNRSSGFEAFAHALRMLSHTTTLEVDLDAFVHNLNVHRALLPAGTKIIAMVKASSYGHGDYEVASMLTMQGVDYLAVAFADEGVKLRQRSIATPIVVLNADEDSFGLMIENALEPEIYNARSLELFVAELRRMGERQYPIHIKLDTGMHRLGFASGDMKQLIELLHRHRGIIRVASIFSHLASADDPTQDDFTRGQIATFDKMSSCVMEQLPYKPLRHLSNSAGMERFPEATFDMCRLGIGLYGVSAVAGLNLRPVSTLRTKIVQIKELEPGDSVGYNRSEVLIRKSTIATVPIGYADGVDRRLGAGKWSVLVAGKRAPIVGRVCMDTIMVDITGIEATEGDSVEIFSSVVGNRVEDMAHVLETIPYEIMTSVSARVKRIYTKD